MAECRVYQGHRGGIVHWHDFVSGETGPLKAEGLSTFEPVQLYEWGRPGLGSHYLALALLTDALGSVLLPGLWAEDYAAQVVAHLPPGGWEITKQQVIDWLIRQLEEELCGPRDPDQVPRADWCVTGLSASQALDALDAVNQEDSDNAEE